MPSPPEDDAEITALLASLQAGDAATLERVYQAVESELRRLARSLRARHTADPAIQTTVLVDEVFVRLVANHNKVWEDRETFFRVAYGTMRRVLADHSRRRRPQTFAEGTPPAVPDRRSPEPAREAEKGELLTGFADALRELEQHDPEAASVLLLCLFGTVDSEIALTAEELRSFSGNRTPLAEIATARGSSVASAHRVLARAMTFLRTRLAKHQ